MDDYVAAITADSPLGRGKWYDYDENTAPGVVNLIANFVFYIQDGGNTYAFAVTHVDTANTTNSNQGSYVFDVKQL